MERSTAHLLDSAPYFDAICVASRVTDKVKCVTALLGFKCTLDMVLYNYGRRRSFTSVLRHQLTPCVDRGALRFDGKNSYHYALYAGAAGWLHADVKDKASLSAHHPFGEYTGVALLSLSHSHPVLTPHQRNSSLVSKLKTTIFFETLVLPTVSSLFVFQPFFKHISTRSIFHRGIFESSLSSSFFSEV